MLSKPGGYLAKLIGRISAVVDLTVRWCFVGTDRETRVLCVCVLLPLTDTHTV